jgi:aminomuconate-semialdehyde/2-hydroxymuconate-6-semialdehyde dehydrogenase
MQVIRNFIQGMYVQPVENNYLPVWEPATGQVYAEVADSTAADVHLAADAAKKALPAWSATSPQERARILMRVADNIEARMEDLAAAESKDSGKPVSLARRMDIPRAAENFRFFATAIMQFASEAHETNAHTINYTLRQPVGVVGCISPWNLPLYLFTWKIAPALAAGNTVVAKPSEFTPMTAYLLTDLCQKAGLPPGVLNIVQGRGHTVGAAICAHPAIKAISFTGSTRTGAEIARTAAPLFKKISLEMGGKNPNIIFADCQYEAMLNTTVRSSFTNQGQICLCGSRILVERSLYPRFKRDFVARTKALVVGPPGNPSSDLGAVVSAEHHSKIVSYLKLARKEGGKILTGGQAVLLPAPHDKGWYIRPTIIEGLEASARCNQEEIFGPVVSIMPFDTEAEALALANSTQYGLSATLWTENLSRAHRFAKNLEAGIVWINTWLLRDLRTPFGGVKQSGVGREGGWEALRFFTEAKNVCIYTQPDE